MGKTGERVQAGIGVLVLAGAGGAFYVYNHDASLKQEVLQATGAPRKPTPKPLANAPIGFNTSKTAFVLPHNLGYLPAPELTLAKSNPAYAAGLANLSDWRWQSLPAAQYDNGLPPSSYGGWFYVGRGGTTSRLNAMGTKYSVQEWNDNLEIPGGSYTGGVALVTTSPVQIRNFTVHALHGFWGSSLFQGADQEVVTPGMLEIRAAPIGGASENEGVCVPTPEAVVQNGRVVTPSGVSPITAGPSTIFTINAGGHLHDQGIASCNGFK
jgi:hypothetical protein